MQTLHIYVSFSNTVIAVLNIEESLCYIYSILTNITISTNPQILSSVPIMHIAKLKLEPIKIVHGKFMQGM